MTLLPPQKALALGACAAFVFALSWWAVVFLQVESNTGLSLSSSVPCLLYTSDRCSLAMALCSDQHFLGIKRYSSASFWLAGALAGLSCLVGRYRPR